MFPPDQKLRKYSDKNRFIPLYAAIKSNRKGNCIEVIESVKILERWNNLNF